MEDGLRILGGQRARHRLPVTQIHFMEPGLIRHLGAQALAEIVQLLTRVVSGVCAASSESTERQGVLCKYEEARFGSRAVKATAV